MLSDVEVAGEGEWKQAVALQLQQQDRARSPGGAGIDLTELVEASRESGVLLADTSYIVVESAAQWRMLEQSEAQKLSQNEALEFLETPAPPLTWLALSLAAWWGLGRLRDVGRMKLKRTDATSG